MPSTVTINVDSGIEWNAINPIVEINGKTEPSLQCLRVSAASGIRPGECILKYNPARDIRKTNPTTRDTSSPNTLNACKGTWKYGSRVRVYYSTNINGIKKVINYFVGTLMVRQDQGMTDDVLWTAYDDRILLQSIHVRGALVYDPDADTSAKFKLIPRYQAQTNPGGKWNCTYATDGNNLIPVFTQDAELVKNYESPDEVFATNSTNFTQGQTIAWTPRRFLLYLQYVANLETGASASIDGAAFEGVRSLHRTSWLEFSGNSISGLTGFESQPDSTTIDPLDRKMPDVNFRGMNMLGALQKALNVSGSHKMALDIDYNDDTKAATSSVKFYPVGFSGVGTSGCNLRMQRGSYADNTRTIFDFNMFEDASNVAESVLVEGDVVRVESEAEYDRTDTPTLEPAWTENEERAFLIVVHGGIKTLETDGSEWARIPPQEQIGSDAFVYDSSKWLEANGEGGRPFAHVHTQDAYNLAQKCFPKVFRAYRLPSDTVDTEDALKGYNDVYADNTKYPRLNCNRPLMLEQLQYITTYMKDDNPANWLKQNYPIRVQVKLNQDSASYYDAPASASISITGDGLIWINGLGASVEGQAGCLYTNKLIGVASNNTYEVTASHVKLNYAMPMDHRVYGYNEVSDLNSKTIFDSEFSNGVTDGKTQMYIDSPGAYIEGHQVNSTPAPSTQYYSGSTLKDAPLNRIVPPGSEAGNAEYAAERKLYKSKNPVKRTSWKVLGIRPEYKIGLWVNKVLTINGATGDTDYFINAPIENIVYDFENQITNVGGLVNEIGI